MTEREIIEAVRNAGKAFASAYAQLLGDGWAAEGHMVAGPNAVSIDGRNQTISWLDLAPDGERRGQRTLIMPEAVSIGAVVAIARALAELDREPRRARCRKCGNREYAAGVRGPQDGGKCGPNYCHYAIANG